MKANSPAEIKSLLDAGGLSVVGFFSDKITMSKIFEAQLDALADRWTAIPFAKVDAGEQPGLVKKYRVRSLPTTIVFADGKPEATIVGMLTIASLREVIARVEGKRRPA